MLDVLGEWFRSVKGTDIADPEDRGWGGYDYLDPSVHKDAAYDWVITNPPFKSAVEFTKKMLVHSRRGAAVLARVQFLESQKRYTELFENDPPTHILVFVNRIQMVGGRLPQPGDGASSIAYAWFVWHKRSSYFARPPSIYWVSTKSAT